MRDGTEYDGIFAALLDEPRDEDRCRECGAPAECYCGEPETIDTVLLEQQEQLAARDRQLEWLADHSEVA